MSSSGKTTFIHTVSLKAATALTAVSYLAVEAALLSLRFIKCYHNSVKSVSMC